MLCIVIRPIKYRAYTLYQLVITILGALALMLWFIGAAEVEWPSVMAAAVSVICFAAMVVFADRSTRNELHKRFHF